MRSIRCCRTLAASWTIGACAHAAPEALPATDLAPAAPPSAAIHVNQVGFTPSAGKIGIVVSETSGTFAVLTTRGDTAFAGTLAAPRAWPPSGETVRQADFTRLTRVGDAPEWIYSDRCRVVADSGWAGGGGDDRDDRCGKPG